GGECVHATEDAVVFQIRSGCEIQRTGVAEGDAVAKCDAPQAVDADDVAVGVLQLAKVGTGHRIVDGDGTVSEVADQQFATEDAKVRWGNGDTPGRIEAQLVRKVPHDMAVAVVGDNSAPGGLTDRFARSVTLELAAGVGDVQPVTDGLDVERREV